LRKAHKKILYFNKKEKKGAKMLDGKREIVVY
jgi:hypothetical protein